MLAATPATTCTHRSRAESALLGGATVLTGLMAGFFYAYACSVMVGLARTDDRTFVAAMQWINATVRNVAFGPVFFGALVLTLAAAVLAVRRRGPGSRLVLAGAIFYAAAFGVTMGVAVPLNEELAAAGPVHTIVHLAAVREAYEERWVAWNILRAALSTAALAALAAALLRRRY